MKKKVILPLLLVAAMAGFSQNKDSVSVTKENREVKIIVRGNEDARDKQIIVYKKYVVSDEEDLDEVMAKLKAESKDPADPKKEIRKQIIIVDTDDKSRVIKQIDVNIPNLDSLGKAIEKEMELIGESLERKGVMVEEENIVIENKADNEIQKEVTVNKDGDTTIVNVGKRKIIITEEGVVVKKQSEDNAGQWEDEDAEDGTCCEGDEKPKRRKKNDVDLFALDLGLNNFITNGQFGKAPANNEMRLNAWKSVNVTTHFLPTRVSLIGNGAVNLKTAISLDFSNLRFQNDFFVNPNSETIVLQETPDKLKKNKMVLTYAQIPLLLNFNTHPSSSKGVSFSVGGYAGYLVDAKTKTKDVDDKKLKNHDDYLVNPLRYGLTARVDFKWIDFYVNYNLSTLFNDPQNNNTQLVAAGINLIDF